MRMILGATIKRVQEADKYAEANAIKQSAAKRYEEELMLAEHAMYLGLIKSQRELALSIWKYRHRQTKTPA